MKKCFIFLLPLFMVSIMANAQNEYPDVSISVTFDGYNVSGTIGGADVPSEPFIDVSNYYPQDSHNGGYGGIMNPFPGYTGQYQYNNFYTIGRNGTNNRWEFSFPISFSGSHTILSLKVYLRSGSIYQKNIPIGFIF